MENEEIVLDENLNTSEEAEPNTADEVVIEETTEESVEEIKARLAKAEELAKNYKIRAEKAEKSKTEVKTQPANSSSMASRDLIALMNAKVHEEDVSEVEDYAKFRGISIAEALKSSVVKTLLQEKAQQRNVALATNIGSARTPSRKLSDDVILSNASKGSLPEDVDSLVSARFKAKRQK